MLLRLIAILLFFSAHSALANEQFYNRSAVVKYATTWWDKNNPDYPIYDFNGKIYPNANDCANYASQLLRAGGMVDVKNNNFQRGDFRQWYYSNGNSATRYSSTWVDARSLYRRLLKDQEKVEFVTKYDEIYAQLQAGDLIFWFSKKSNGTYDIQPHHISVVVWAGTKNGVRGLSITSHTKYRKDDSLRKVFDEYNGQEKIVGIKIKYTTKNSKNVTSINIPIIVATNKHKNNFAITLDKVIEFLGIPSAFAQSSLFAYLHQPYTVRVDGTGFDGNEAVSVDGSTCDKSTIQRGSGYFTQSCTGGSAAGDANKIRVYDTQYDLDIEVPTAYQTMQLRGPILAPLAPALSELTTGTIRLSWSSVNGATGYEVSRSGVAINTVGTTTSYDDAGRTAGTPYCYRLRTIQGGIMSAYSPEACYTPATIKCSGTWNNTQYSVGATESMTQACQAGYTGNKSLSHICQASGHWGATTTQDNCTLTPAPTCTGSWSSAKYLVGQTEEVYQNTCPAGTTGQVRSWHTCQASGNSAVWGGLAQSDNCTAYLATPTGVYASSTTGGVQITWDSVSGATSYNLYKSGSLYRSNITNTSFVDSYVTNGATYSYSVSAYSNYNGGNITSPISGSYSVVYRDGQTGVNPPTNVSAEQYTEYSRKGIRLTWSGAANADSYFVYRRGYSNPYTSATYLAPVGGGDISFTDWVTPGFSGGVIPGQSYCYYIRSIRGSVNSTESNETCAMAP